MKKINYLRFMTVCLGFSLFTVGCSTPADKSVKGDSTAVATKPDLVKMKADIQSLESDWSKADNARDTNAIVAFYSDDAVSMGNNKPMLVGKEAITKDVKESLAKRLKGSTQAYTVMDVYGDENAVTETGSITTKDASGKVMYTGKYMAVWEKRNGKYICVRDINNDDVKAK